MLSWRPLPLALLGLLFVAGCSSAPPAGKAAAAGPITSDETWSDGTVLSSPVLIKAGAKVTIAAGATVHVQNGVQITVEGALASEGGNEARLTGDTTWEGLLIASGGTLALKNVDIANTVTAISVNAGAAAVSYDQGTISASQAPFAIQAGAKVTTAHATVTGSLGTTRVQGELDASYLDYDAGNSDGITAEGDAAVLRVEDSELHGSGTTTADMVVSYLGAQLIHVAYTEIKSVHCAFHIERVSSIDVSYVNAVSDSFGAMLYGSLSSGTRTFDSVNFANEAGWGIDEEDGDVNGAITISNSYIGNNAQGNVHLQTASNIQVTSPASALIASAKPR